MWLLLYAAIRRGIASCGHNFQICDHYLIAEEWNKTTNQLHIDGLVQNCSNSSVLAMELLQSST